MRARLEWNMTSRAKDNKTSKLTTDHDEIRRWVEARGGTPARVRGTTRAGGSGLLRIDVPGFTGAGTLETISWDEWFAAFDEHELALVYQEEKKSGEPSTFAKLVRREAVPAGTR